ncbi:hypothetical protein FOBRF1_012287 [Fusarium oxysporum]
MAAAFNIVRQSLFAGSPRYTENDLPDLKGKVIAITGSNTGVGKEIAKMVYSKNAKVYMFARTTTKNEKARDEIKAAFPDSRGELICIQLDLADLDSVQAAAAEFISKEDKLHVLFNNAGVGFPEYGFKTKQGYELQLGVNCLGSFALTQRLTPVLVNTAKASTPGTVRVVWASSTAAFWTSTKKYIERVKAINKQSLFQQYAISKLGNYYHATEYAARRKCDGIISVPLNPGNLDSDLWRTQGKFLTWILRRTVFYPPRYGGYVNIFAGFSPEVTLENSGRFISPWGRLWHALPAMVKGSKTEAEGGTGHAKRFWEWTEEQVSQNVSAPSAKEPLVGAESLKVGCAAMDYCRSKKTWNTRRISTLEVSGRGFEELSITDSEDIDKETFKNPAHWNNTSSEDAVTSASVNVVSMSGSFEQDTCPDYSALYDLVNTFIALNSPGIPEPNEPGKGTPDRLSLRPTRTSESRAARNLSVTRSAC